MASAQEPLLAIQRRFVRLNSTLSRVDALSASGRLTDYDVSQIYSGVFLESYIAVERLIEELFLGYLIGRYKPIKTRIAPAVTIATRPMADRMLKGERKYLDWLPFRLTSDRASIYFRGQTPFSVVGPTDIALLEELGRIRNALAHQSAHSLDIFSRFVVGAINIRPRDKYPPRYLRSVLRLEPRQTRLQNYMVRMLDICQRICT